MTNKIIMICAGLLSVGPALATSGDYFPSEMLRTDGNVVDLSYLAIQNVQPEGDYIVDIYINNTFWRTMNLFFKRATPASDSNRHGDTSGLVPCLTASILQETNLIRQDFSDLQQQTNDSCVLAGDVIKDAFTRFTFQQMRLDISIPQAAMRQQPRGYISPELWDQGINGAHLNYAFSGSRYINKENNADNYFMRINSGINLGPWRLHDFRTWNYQADNTGHYQQLQHLRTYLERSLIPMRSNFIAGESNTVGDIFESTEYTGFSLATDDNMYPDSMRGFAPVVQGVAETNAEVTIIQNGYRLYRTFVPPGAFEISDLPSSHSSNDLEVIVKEANGTVRRFFLPYSALPVMLRKGRMKYSLTAGKYRASHHDGNEPLFFQSTLVYGLQEYLTLYAGGQLSGSYSSLLAGAGVNAGLLGAVSADVTRSQSQLSDHRAASGGAVRVNYSPARIAPGTDIHIGYQAFSDNFRSFNEAMQPVPAFPPASPQYTTYSAPNNRSRRTRLTLNVSQRLNDIGHLFLSGTRQTYWHSREKSTFLQMGFSSSLFSVNYNLNYGYSWLRDHHGSYALDRSISLYLTVPLSALFGRDSRPPAWATMISSRDNRGNSDLQAGLSGVLFEDRSLSWNLTQGRTGSGSLNYKGRYGETNVGYTYGNTFRQFNYGVAGSALLHDGGLTFGQPGGETKVLISSSGVPDVQVEDLPGVITDRNGFAIEPYASAWRENRIALDHNSLSDRIEINNDVIRVVPTKGAIVRAEFDVSEGYRVLLSLNHQGRPVPFGSVVQAGKRGGIVGDDGEVYLSGLPESGRVDVSWGSQASKQCSATYTLSPDDKTRAVARLSGVCQ